MYRRNNRESFLSLDAWLVRGTVAIPKSTREQSAVSPVLWPVKRYAIYTELLERGTCYSRPSFLYLLFVFLAYVHPTVCLYFLLSPSLSSELLFFSNFPVYPFAPLFFNFFSVYTHTFSPWLSIDY